MAEETATWNTQLFIRPQSDCALLPLSNSTRISDNRTRVLYPRSEKQLVESTRVLVLDFERDAALRVLSSGLDSIA